MIKEGSLSPLHAPWSTNFQFHKRLIEVTRPQPQLALCCGSDQVFQLELPGIGCQTDVVVRSGVVCDGNWRKLQLLFGCVMMPQPADRLADDMILCIEDDHATRSSVINYPTSSICCSLPPTFSPGLPRGSLFALL